MDLRDQLERTLGAAYRLERELGGGGMSRVFVAEETALGRKVVVKVLPQDSRGDVNIERFKREIQVAARLQHAHIVPVLAAGDTDGLPYYTMPFVDGESLRHRLSRSGALPITETVSILRDVARALAYAHHHAVVHRDIKPDNVMLAGGSAVVTDFGIAKAISASRQDGPGATLTQIGTSLGTPAYMAPEQAAGDPATDHRADLYAFGCMAYEMLTGRPPFVESSPQALLAAHMARTPEPVLVLRPDTPPALASLVTRCLQKEADDRPATAQELAQALDLSTTTASGEAAVPLLAAPGSLRQALALYGGAFLIVALLAKAAVSFVGLPEWVFPGALIVMALGLPAILATGYVHRVSRRAETIPTQTPGGTPATHGTLATMALKASPHVTWRRTMLAGGAAVGAFVVLVGGFMLLRSLGIGPAGSLLAAGRFEAREPILVTDFAVVNADSSLGRVLSDATKTTLSQSSVITLLPAEGVTAALARMERPRNSVLHLELARELATRNGIRLIADGQVTGVTGGGYIVRLRLVTADSVKELASHNATAAGVEDLIDVIDDLSRRLRGRIGESLRSVNAAPRLARVTTASFEALRKYTEADRAEQIEGNRPRAIQLLREAVVIDSTFAEAWRRLGIILTNAGGPRAEIDSALFAAYRHRDRTSDAERAFIEATWLSSTGSNRDRAKGIGAYEEMLRRGDTVRAGNNLAIRLMTRREYARAESLYRAGLRLNPDASRIIVPNLLINLVTQQKFSEADSVVALWGDRLRTNTTMRLIPVSVLVLRNDTAAYRAALDSVAAQGDSLDRNWARIRLGDLALMEGRVREFISVRQELDRNPDDAQERLFRSMNLVAQVRAEVLDQREAVARELDDAIAALERARLPDTTWPHLGIANTYAFLDRPVQAREWYRRNETAATDTVNERLELQFRQRTLAGILAAEGRHLDAVTEYRKSDRLPDGPQSNCMVCLPMQLAFTFDAAAMPDSAIFYQELALATYDPNRISDVIDPVIVPLFSERLGQLYEARGDRVKAVEHYRRFVQLWAKADPELQPRVAEARARIRRLADSELPR
jgi:tetratricopeptide (TPR) repeat protein